METQRPLRNIQEGAEALGLALPTPPLSSSWLSLSPRFFTSWVIVKPTKEATTEKGVRVEVEFFISVVW